MKTSTFTTVFIVGIITGLAIYKYDIFPIPQIRYMKAWINPPANTSHLPDTYNNKVLTQYTQGTPVFSDRNYFDDIGDSTLNDSYVLQIPRHYHKDIIITINRPVTIYRVLTSSNDNSIFESWKKTNIKINVKGNSCVHNKIVSKEFNKGLVTLKSGGPVASSPIIIKEKKYAPIEYPITIN